MPLEREGYQLEVSQSLQETVGLLQAWRPDLIVLQTLSRQGQVELVAIDRLRGGATPIPLLVVSEEADAGPAATAARQLEGRAWDLIRRDATPDEISLRAERLQRELVELREMETWRHRAVHDDRTELLRPAAFEQRMQEHFSAAQRHTFELAFALIDLDRFGQVNKEHDHTVGDALISSIGGVLRRTLRAEDCAGRLGGDEFGIVLPFTGKVDAGHVIGRLLERIRRLAGRFHEHGVQIGVTASVGFETFDGADLDSARTLGVPRSKVRVLTQHMAAASAASSRPSAGTCCARSSPARRSAPCG